MSRITFEDKEQLITNPNIPRKNKVVADDVNEIKRAINDNDDSIEELDTRKADRTEIPTNLNQLSNADTKFVNETQMANAVQQETTARQNSDVALQNQIDAITSQSDVVDIVGTYAELLNYDTSTITENDIIKVLQDSTHDNATSYFRWADNSWGYVGSEGPYYTKGETDERLNQKANQTSLDQTNENLNTLSGRVGTNETEISGIKAEQATQNRQIATLIADSGNKIELAVNSQTYILTATLKNKAGEILNSSQIDLPLEAMIVNAEYDSTTKELVLTLQNGTTLRVSLADIVSGLVSQDDFDALEDRVDDLEGDVADIKNEQETQNAEIEELQEQVQILENTVNSELEDATATGTEISVTDSANALAKLLPSGNTYQQDFVLPSEYIPLDYIQSTGTQYIDTGYIPNSNTKIEVLAQYPKLGADSGWGNKAFCIAEGPFSFSNLALNFQPSQDKNLIILENGKIETSLGKKTFSANEFQGEYNLLLFGINRNGNVQGKSNGCKIYYLKLWENDVLIRDFIPCKNGNNEIGLYDLVNATFYGNAGTGEFVASEEGNPIHVVKGHNEFLAQSKNLFPTNKIRTDLDWLTVNEDGSVTIVYESGPNINFTNIFKDWIFIPKGNYILKLFVEGTFRGGNYLVFNGEHVSITQNTISTTSYSPITNDSIGNLQLYVVQAGTNCTIRFELEEGTETPTKYFPHEEQTLELDLPEGMEMCKIGDYADTFENVDGKWYKNEIIKKFLFNGSENWTGWNVNLHEYQIETNVADNRVNGAWITALCDKFVNNNVGGSSMNNNEFSAFVSTISDPQRHIWFRFKKDPINNVNDFKIFVANNPLTVYTILEKINPIEITDQTLISQLDKMQKILSHFGGTNITTISAGDLQPILNFEYKKSNRLRIEAIEEKINSIQGG